MESRWVTMESWTFSTVIRTQEVAALLGQQQVLLQLDGVDTYADVLLNGKKVAATTNFHRWAAAQTAAGAFCSGAEASLGCCMLHTGCSVLHETHNQEATVLC